MLNIISNAAASAEAQAVINTLIGGDELAVPQEMFVQRSSIVVNHNLSIRVLGVDKDQVSRYKEAYEIGSDLPLIEIFIIDGVLYLVDGFHRITALDQIAVEKAQVDFSVMARVRTGTWAEAEIFAADANVRHGYPLSKEDIQAAARRYLRNTALSYAEIGRRLNIHHTTVLRLDRKEKIRSTAAETVTYERSDEGEVVVKQIETAAAPGDAGAPAGATAPVKVEVKRGKQRYEMDKTRIGKSREPRPGEDPKQIRFWISRGWTFTYRATKQVAVNEDEKVATALVSSQRELLSELIQQRYTPENYIRLQQLADEESEDVRAYSPVVVVDASRARLRSWLAQIGLFQSLLDEAGVELQHDVSEINEHLRELRLLIERRLGGP